MTARFGLQIRAADAGDVEGLAELLRVYPGGPDVRALGTRLQNMTSADGVVLLAEEWGPPIGVIAVNWHWTLLAELRTAYVTALVVDTAARRRGIARLLLKSASRAARAAQCGEVVIVAITGAAHLREFCLATGFMKDGDVFTRSLRKGH